jgi:hypothetical protein
MKATQLYFKEVYFLFSLSANGSEVLSGPICFFKGTIVLAPGFIAVNYGMQKLGKTIWEKEQQDNFWLMK